MSPNPASSPSLFRLFLRMGGWIVLITGALLLIFSIASHQSLKTAKRFETEGRIADARIVDRDTTTSTDSDGKQSTNYWLTFHYVTTRGEEIELRRSVPSSVYRENQVGDHFDLLYLESAPRKTEVTPGTNRTMSRVMQIVALVMGLIWLAALWKVGGWAVAAVRARRYGTREEARVTEVYRTGFKVNNRPRYRLKWVDAQGKPGTSLMHKANALSDFKAGDSIGIYQGVKYSWWVGDIGERDG